MEQISKAIEAMIEFEKHFRPSERVRSATFYRSKILEIIDLLQGIRKNGTTN